MRRRCAIAGMGAVAAASVLSSVGRVKAGGGGMLRRAVVFVVDDMGWDPQVYGGEAIMPAYAAIAANGALYRKAFSAANVCAPGRAAIQAGRIPTRTFVTGNGPEIAAQEYGIAQLPCWTATHFLGKWHLGRTAGASTPIALGYQSAIWRNGGFSGDVNFISSAIGDDHDNPNYQTSGDSTLVLADLAVAWLQALAHADEDFLLVVCPTAGHSPYTAGQEWLDLYDPAHPKRQYLAELSCMDEALRRIRQALIDLDLHEDTLLWVVGDNGGTYRTGPDGRGKTAVGARASLVVEGPGFDGLGEVQTPAFAHQDLIDTLAAMAAVTPQQGVRDGQDIRTVARAHSLFMPLPKMVGGVLVGWQRLHLVDAAGEWRFERVGTTDKLWHLPVSETQNVAGANPTIVAAMRDEALSLWEGVAASWAGADY